MAQHLVGEIGGLGTGSNLGEVPELETRKGWQRELASGGWVGIGWPAEFEGRELHMLSS